MIKYIWQEEKWPAFSWQSDAVLEALSRCNFKRGQLLRRVASLGMEFGLEAQAAVLATEVLQTSAIEGHSLDPDSVRSSVARRLGLPEAGLDKHDHYTEGLVDVLLDVAVNYNKTLTIERLHGWQAALFPTGFSGLNRIVVGDFRRVNTSMQVVSGPIGREKIHYEAPPGERIEKEVTLFLQWWQKKQDKLDGILRSAIAGFWFVSIHPYEDGNGRLSRVITDMALAQDEKLAVRYYSISAQVMEERLDYYAMLEKCQKGSLDISDWLVWFLGCFERALARSDGIIGKVLQKARFWEINSQIPITARQCKVINRLLEAGPVG
ncbi:Fic family protein, partial [bacterium]|nr:Fic family protein [bacterium]